MVDILRSQERPPFLDFENIDAMADKVVREWTGLNKAQFNKLFLDAMTQIPIESLRPKTAYGLWLAKCRTGESDEKIAELAGLPRSTASALVETARKSLGEWAYLHLGFSHLDREDLKHHMTTVARKLFCDGDKVAIVLDGTYIYIQKSSNYGFQRHNYSGHKHRPLLKPFMIVAPDGYIIDVFGPYEANVNDAAIMRQLSEQIRSALEKDDVVLVDRDFRDVVDHLTTLGLDVRMPDLKSGNQLTTEQANRTRLVTKCRYIVEARNGHLKLCFRHFDRVWPNQSIPHMMKDFRIACAILNVFHQTIESDVRDGLALATSMLDRFDEDNLLAKVTTALHLNRESSLDKWERIEESHEFVVDFPHLSEEDLRSITLGSYQLRQARSYYAEHIKTNGSYVVDVCKHIGNLPLSSHGLSVGDPMLIRGRIQSRHRSSHRYFIYILIDRLVLKDEEKDGVDAVSGYCCSCPNGLRTVGCCAHVATVLWYLGFGRHQSEIPIPAAFLNDVCVELEGQEQE
jgi:hypothetical protein